MVTFSMTLTISNPVFKVAAYLKSNISVRLTEPIPLSHMWDSNIQANAKLYG